ncbi:hypothetical protein LA080_005479 [Diaporthe eres]|nr:hypothetical protein LA080_005479 [Diaporthe eres]
MVRRFSSLFFRQSSQDIVAQAAADNVQAGASHLGVTLNPIQRTDFSRQAVRHVKSSEALLGTLRSLQYNTHRPPPLPTQSARGLGDLQECFWLEDSLNRTTSQLDRCSNQLDQIHGSAAEVRLELEGLQVELGLLQKKIQLGANPMKGDEPRSDPRSELRAEARREARNDSSNEPESEPRNEPRKPVDVIPKQRPRPVDVKPKQPTRPVDVTPKQPAIAKPSSIQQRIQFFSKIASS